MSDYITFYRVARPFTFGSRSFAKGEILRPGPIVERIEGAHPDWLLITVRSISMGSPRQEVAGLRSSDFAAAKPSRVRKRKPRRNWLAADWRIP